MDAIIAKTAVVIFIKNLVSGKVKTRIAAQAGNEQACSIYEELQRITASVCNLYKGPKYLYYSDFISEDDIWDAALYTKKLQVGTDLGSRMHNAFEEILHIHEAAFIIGSDCPYLKLEDLILAAEKLENNDLVLGPAGDGGFYLIGAHTPQPELLLNREWSQPDVFNITTREATKLNFKTKVLKMLWDIDSLADWQLYQQITNSGLKR